LAYFNVFLCYVCVFLKRRAWPATPARLHTPEVIQFVTSPSIGPQTL
jgi:hypothetical protein